MLALSLAVRLTAVCVLGWLAVVDVRARRLPDAGVLAVAVLFLADALATRLSLAAVGLHFGVALAVYVVCALLFALKLLGGGDAKLAAALFLWAGPGLSLPMLTLISVTGTLVGLTSLATSGMEPAAHGGPLRALAMFSSRRGVPYGVALALGGGAAILLPALLPFVFRH